MKYLLTIQKEIPITGNEYPCNTMGYETVIENYIGDDNWVKKIQYEDVILNIFPLTDEQEKCLPYGQL